MLDPTEFGLFALEMLALNLFDHVKDLGVTGALIQSRRDWATLAPTGLIHSLRFGPGANGLLGGHRRAQCPDAGTARTGPPRRSMNFAGRMVPESAGALAKTVLTI